MKRLFGTDGIRAVAGRPPLDPSTVRRFGVALAEALEPNGSRTTRVLLGRDTRESGPWLRDAVATGLRARGVSAVDAGVLSTPGLSWAIGVGGFDAGVMISASHNPYQDNGLKVFDRNGAKLCDETEKKVEALILDRDDNDPGEAEFSIETDDQFSRRYVEKLCAMAPSPDRLRGLRICLDCGNGAASKLAPVIYRAWGAEVHAVGTEPNGRNINLDCGSLHLEQLSTLVRDKGFDLGIAFDGDADRCLAVDSTGRMVDGDHILYITGRGLKRRGQLRGDGLVATIMSNLWLADRLDQEGIRMHRAPVGDKYVLERMLAEGLTLGGEQSGHVIFLEHATTGDGMLTGLLLLDLLADEDESLDQILGGIVPYPQVLINVRVREKPDLRKHSKIGPVVAEIEKAIEGAGRVVLRYSGTESLARVMIEGREAEAVHKHAERLAETIRESVGE